MFNVIINISVSWKLCSWGDPSLGKLFFKINFERERERKREERRERETLI